jgi:hypothetical protein
MKRVIFLTTLLLLTSAAFVSAQERRGGGEGRMTVEERAKAITEWMTRELSLSPEQIVPVDSINLVFTKAQQIIFQSVAEGNREEIRNTMMALEKEKENALSAVLTEAQLALYKQKRDEMSANRRRR